MGQKRWNRDRNAGSQWKFSSEILQRIQRKKNFCDTTIFRDFVKFWLCSRWQCIVYISGTENKIKSWPFEIFGCLRCGNDLFFYGGWPRAKKIFASKWDEKSFFGRKWKLLALFKESWWHGHLVPEAPDRYIKKKKKKGVQNFSTSIVCEFWGDIGAATWWWLLWLPEWLLS